MKLLTSSELESFGLSSKDIDQHDERTFSVTKWEWPYERAHTFQRKCLDILKENPRLRILISCNHPRVFTNGRGLQRPRKGETLSLVEFDPYKFSTLPYPLHQIERGGGLTFHHTGQFIFYPIVKLNPKTLSLSRMIDDIFEVSACILSEWGLSNLSFKEELMGLWKDGKKIASMGIAIERLTTFHGMALNLYRDDEIMRAMNNLNPCGLSANTYCSVDDLIDLKGKNVFTFQGMFMKRITDAWK